MPFVLYCIDKPGRAARRTDVRAAHLAYVSQHPQRFVFGGPLQDPSGLVRGSLMILDLPDHAALHEHMRGDPFFGADLFESVTVWTTRQVVPERDPGALALELDAARAPTPPSVGPRPLAGEAAA